MNFNAKKQLFEVQRQSDKKTDNEKERKASLTLIIELSHLTWDQQVSRHSQKRKHAPPTTNMNIQ